MVHHALKTAQDEQIQYPGELDVLVSRFGASLACGKLPCCRSERVDPIIAQGEEL